MSRSRILITGDREWSGAWAHDAIQVVIQGLDLTAGYDTIVHGAARGVDMLADGIAKSLGLVVEQHPADWDRYGAAAGPIRNAEMLKHGHIDQCWAFHDDLDSSKGTRDMTERCKAKNIPTILVGRLHIPDPTLWGTDAD